MNIAFWDKDKLKQLTEAEKELWFDVLNHELELDRGINLSKLTTSEKQQIQDEIKSEYFQYLDQLSEDKNFLFYTLLMDDFGKIVSMCRLIKRDQLIYVGGLETHRDFRNLGYGRIVLSETAKSAFENGYSVIHSVIRSWNEASIKAHKSIGFRITENKGDSLVLSLGNIRYLSKAIIEEFIGAKIDEFKLLKDHFEISQHDSYYEFYFNEKHYVAKFRSASREKTSEIIKYIRDKQTDKTTFLESKVYGFTHKFHIHGRDYWVWVESYKP